jgi:cytochrome P450
MFYATMPLPGRQLRRSFVFHVYAITLQYIVKRLYIKLYNLAQDNKTQKMKSILFLQSEVQNPYKIYNEMLLTNPVYRDEVNNISAVYSYENCKSILTNPAALIPPLNNTGLNEHALAIAGKLVRFSNPPDHAVAKQTAMAIFQSMKPVSIQNILYTLLHGKNIDKEINWVDVVCKQLPVLCILKGFDFTQTDCEFVAGKIGQLVKIIQPNKTEDQLKVTNDVSKEVYDIVERHISNSPFLSAVVNNLVAGTKCTNDEILALCISNLTGLMIQSYDACRGLLSNTLLHFLNNRNLYKHIINNRNNLEKFVIETLRFDPPVHNTRRIAAEKIVLDNAEIKKGEIILVVLASANRDEQHFTNANIFDVERNNNSNNLTFGAGQHSCLAMNFATRITTETLFHLFIQFTNTTLLSPNIEHEAIVNVRLPKSIIISLI